MKLHEFVIIQTTIDTAEEADRLASAAVDQQLAACVQIANVTSYYQCQGRTQHEPEWLLSFKTTRAAVAAVKDYLTTNHSYDEPEIVVTPIVDGSAGYLQWIENSVS